MLRQMWKKRVCFVLAVILAVIAVTPMEMEHTDAAMVHSVTALMTGNLVNKSNADKLTYRQLETSAYERKLISKSVYNYTMQQVPALYEGRNVINVSGMTGKANTSYVDAQTIAIKEGTSLLAAEKTTEGTESATEAAGTQIEETTGAVSDDDLIDVTEQESEVKFQFEEEDTSTDDATGEFSQVYTYIIYK